MEKFEPYYYVLEDVGYYEVYRQCNPHHSWGCGMRYRDKEVAEKVAEFLNSLADEEYGS